MEKVLKTSLENREALIEGLEQEIVGPGNMQNCTKLLNVIGSDTFHTFEELNTNYYWISAGKKEEVLQNDSPSRRYAAGMLYPAHIKYEEAEEVELIINEVQDEENKEFYAANEGNQVTSEEMIEESGLEETAPKINQNDYMPSSIGMTFCLAKNAEKFTVKFDGGMYKKHKIYADVQDEKGHHKLNRDWWLRESIKAEKTIDVNEFVSKSTTVKEFPLELEDLVGNCVNRVQLYLHIQCRVKSEYLLITVTVLNKTNIPFKAKLDEYSVFQSQITIQEESGAFLNYPKAYQRNIDLTEDEWNNELLFKNKANYAFGHGCSVIWNHYQESIVEIRSTFIPRYESESMTPDIKIKVGDREVPLVIRMYDLMQVETYDEAKQILSPLIHGYEQWILDCKKEAKKLSPQLNKAAHKNLELCRDSLRRMDRGLNLLKNPDVLKAFKLANKAILLQQINGKEIRTPFASKQGNKLSLNFDKPFEDVMEKMDKLCEQKNSWRAFQIAFFLLSIQSLVEKNSVDRKTVDLIWFPTGGGKTEAYLGVAAFQMFYRRILDPSDAGVDVMMRYTLRLLTADQFQRASRLMCSMEYIRRQNEYLLGEIPYSIGIWVGSATSPNNNKEALKQLRAMPRSKGRDNFVVTRCPWCGCSLGKIIVTDEKGKSNDSVVVGFSNVGNEIVVRCPDKKCDFSGEIPVYFVDEIIYKKKPTFLIGTIDKFVQLTWKPEARELFGINKLGERFISPPQIIVQDELHLISGPLGTLAGLYEVLVEELCIDDRGEEIIYPKIISATATIKEFEEQAKCLFGRTSAKLFPSPGIDIDNSFFSKVAVDEKGIPMPGRKYVGVFTSRVKILMAQVMSYAAILQKVEGFPENERDPFWTLLSFYNSLRDLGAGINLFNSDIPTYIDSLVKREGLPQRRILTMPLELTSRKQSSEISKTIDDLNIPYRVGVKKSSLQALTTCLASNIIEVGVDIDRLSLMGIIGQPKMTAQYIQVSGRVGRRPHERPGLIVTIYSNQNSRDKSHFEHFNEYHQRLYAQVETTSLTPFSTASIERGITAVLIGFLRQRLSWDIAVAPTSKEIQRANKDPRFIEFRRRANARVRLIDEDQIDVWKEHVKIFMQGAFENRYESWRVSDDSHGLMHQAGKLIDQEKYPDSIPVINSLRSVDAESRGSIVRLEQETDLDWEDID
ncbi:helicase-related protein [Priestia megaterium]|uniref:helicase-related protein n=1 Tax=Priestia megaterium TaxID=1404 RepID=UPI0023DC6FA5|nr:helicase-related protein [Priestia megaterium]MDF2012300.1 helicase-related protein [Priestia megaterium]